MGSRRGPYIWPEKCCKKTQLGYAGFMPFSRDLEVWQTLECEGDKAGHNAIQIRVSKRRGESDRGEALDREG